MKKQIVAPQTEYSFGFEVLNDDPDQIGPWIEPETLKLTHRIGKGTFGDVWLATHFQFSENNESYHEVAVKMFPLMKKEHTDIVLAKVDSLFSKCHEFEGVCLLYGFSVISGKICIVMNLCDESIGDRIARLKGGKLNVHDVLRYGEELAKGILELHSKGVLVLNLKPSNVLLDQNNKAVLGDFGYPYVLLGSPSESSYMSLRLGTPNYMAPEQWKPEVRGPISYETDSWGFGCTIVEMLTGVRPWRGKSEDEIYNLVVIKHEKPQIPIGLPSLVENVLLGCFEYDLRNRPLITDILKVFKSYSSQSLVVDDGGLISLRNGKSKEMPKSNLGYTEWLLLKDPLQVGDTVRSRKPQNSCRQESMIVPEGTVVGIEQDTDHEPFVLVRVHGIHGPLRVRTSTLERVTLGLAAGDWLRLKDNQKEQKKRSSPIGVLHSIQRDGQVAVGFIGIETLWEGQSSEFEMAKPFCPGQFVRLRSKVLSPRFDWTRKRCGDWATGRVLWVLPNGCLVVKFPGIWNFEDKNGEFLADPAEVEPVSFETCLGIVKKYDHLEDFHWAVRPLLVALGLFAAMKMGFFIGGKMRSNPKKQRSTDKESKNRHNVDGKNTGNSGWPSHVAKLF